MNRSNYSLFRHSSAVAICRPSAVGRRVTPANGLPPSTAASRSAGSTVGGALPALFGSLLLFVLLVVMPIVMLVNGVAPEATLGWMALVVSSMADIVAKVPEERPGQGSSAIIESEWPVL